MKTFPAREGGRLSANASATLRLPTPLIKHALAALEHACTISRLMVGGHAASHRQVKVVGTDAAGDPFAFQDRDAQQLIAQLRARLGMTP